jgi:hypothetical protein
MLQASNTTTFANNPCFDVLPAVTQAPVAGAQPVCGGFSTRVDVVLPPGTYFVLVYDQGHNHGGAYTLLYQRLRAAAAVNLVSNAQVAESIAPISDVDLYRFTLNTADRVVLQASNTAAFAINPCFQVLTAVTELRPPAERSAPCGGLSSRLELSLAAGTHYVLVYDQGHNHTGPYTLLFQRLFIGTAATTDMGAAAAALVPEARDLQP